MELTRTTGLFSHRNGYVSVGLGNSDRVTHCHAILNSRSTGSHISSLPHRPEWKPGVEEVGFLSHRMVPEAFQVRRCLRATGFDTQL